MFKCSHLVLRTCWDLHIIKIDILHRPFKYCVEYRRKKNILEKPLKCPNKQ